MRKILTIFILIIVSFGLFGCFSNRSDKGDCQFNHSLMEEGVLSVNYELLNPNLKLNDNESGFVCYVDKEVIVFSVGKRNKLDVGPLVDTEYLAVYNFKKKQVVRYFYTMTESFICDVIPYHNGILYSTYKRSRIEKQIFEWEVVYINSQGKKLLDEGQCTSYEMIPSFTLINSKPVYLLENISNGKYICCIKRITNMRLSTIFISKTYKLLETTIDGNGKQYCFLAVEDNQPMLIIGDEKEILIEYKIQGKINSFDINKKYALISLQEDSLQQSLHTLDLKSKKELKYNFEEGLYRLTGGTGEDCLCVDWEFTPYQINLEKQCIFKLKKPKKYENESQSISFYPISNLRYVISLDIDDKWSLYLMDLE
ncbi:hypothetical protein [Emergencia timonensis]|uniref:hypothetical protein n=1 Tax=Emergencia timonensis TaxID=1776384 RepID=UPI003996343C